MLKNYVAKAKDTFRDYLRHTAQRFVTMYRVDQLGVKTKIWMHGARVPGWPHQIPTQEDYDFANGQGVKTKFRAFVAGGLTELLREPRP